MTEATNPAADARTSTRARAADPVAPITTRAGAESGNPAVTQQQEPLPERPQLAPGVELRGQMTESAFKNPPWLVDRGGRYMQVSYLLYAVAEQIDGRRTIAEIARAVSDKVKRDVTPQNVAAIVIGLLGAGVVRRADGSVFDPSTVPGGGTPSPLALNMKMKMLGPNVIEPLTSVLRILYWPPVVLAVLALVAVAEFWLYFVHGVGQGLHQALYQPTLLLNILAAIVLAAGFHELGHAAALHYGGGKVKGMGAGLYMVYPAFYTDVTDNYRLSRWARVRTDLGGFYFNVIFALVVLGLWLFTGWEFLLLIVVLINIEIIHQLLPFVRLDGYWTLADITGIPDFFTQIGPFLRSVLPSWVPFPEGKKLPELKTWAKVFFLAYIAVTIPLLLFLLFLMLRAVPRILATLLDSMRQQIATLQQALGAGDTAAIVLAALQVVIIALPTLGLVYTLYTVGRRLTVALWNWSKKSTARRAIAGLAGAAVVVFVMLLWLPQVLVPGTPPPGAPGNPLTPVVQPFTGLIQFEPIRADERFTVGEAAAATAPPAGVTTPGGSEPDAGAGGTGGQPATSPAPGSTAQPTPDQGGANPTATPGSSGGPTSTLAPTSTAPSATQSASPTP